MDKLRPEGINPFGIYLDLDCNSDISSTLDRWETSIKLAIAVNRMTNDDAKRYIGMAMIKSALQFWQYLNIDTKAQDLEGDNIMDCFNSPQISSFYFSVFFFFFFFALYLSSTS